MTRFYWLRDGHGRLTVASCFEDRWTILGGLSGWWSKVEVQEVYTILGEIPKP